MVTGANSGIGKATALGLGRAGADVVVNYVADREAVEEVAQQIASFGVRSAAYEADVSQEEQVVAMTEDGRGVRDRRHPGRQRWTAA